MSRGRGKHNSSILLGRPRQVSNLHLAKAIRTKAAFCQKYDYNERFMFAAGDREIEDSKWIDYLIKDNSNMVRRATAARQSLSDKQFQTMWADYQKGLKASEGVEYSLIANQKLPANILDQIIDEYIAKGTFPNQPIMTIGRGTQHNHIWGNILNHPSIDTHMLEKIHNTDNMHVQSAAYIQRKELYTEELLNKVVTNLEHISMNALIELVQDKRIAKSTWQEVLQNPDLPVYQRRTIEFEIGNKP